MAAPQDSNERLANVFEMLVSRLDTLESGIANLNARFDRQDTYQRHSDSLQELGEPMSGMMLCGQCIDLRVHQKISADGSFEYAVSDDVVIVLMDLDFTDFWPDPMWCNEEEPEWRWDADILKQWGLAKRDLVHNKMIEWHRDCDMTICPSPEDVGIEGSFHNDAYSCIQEAALKSRHPGLLAIGRSGVAIRKCTIPNAVDMIDAIAQDLECTSELQKRLDFHTIRRFSFPLARAIIAETPYPMVEKDYTKRRDAWASLSIWYRRSLVADQDNPDVFFTRSVLEHCH